MRNDLMSKNSKEKHTSKKIKFVGQQTFINTATGKIEEMQVTSIEERDFNFSKVWMQSFLSHLDLIGNQKIKIANWIIDNLDKNNKLIATNKLIADSTGVSQRTVSTTMTILQESNFLKKIANGVYIIDPDTYFKGTRKARLNILNQFQELGEKEPILSNSQKIKNIEQAIATLQKQLVNLKSNVIDTEIDGQLELLPNGDIVERARDVKK